MTPLVVFTGRARSGKDTAARFLCEEYNGVAIAFADPIKRFLAAVYGLNQQQLWGSEKEVEIINLPAARAHDFVNTLERVVGLPLTNELHHLNTRFANWRRDYAIEGFRTTPRRLMQTFGTEVVRAVRPNLWLEVGLRDTQRLLEGGMGYFQGEGVVPVPGKSPSLVCITDGRFRNEMLGVKRMGGLCVRIDRPTENGLSDVAKAHASETEQSTIPGWWYDRVVMNQFSLEDLRSQMKSFGSARLG